VYIIYIPAALPLEVGALFAELLEPARNVGLHAAVLVFNVVEHFGEALLQLRVIGLVQIFRSQCIYH
jgi:hypothetical protein